MVPYILTFSLAGMGGQLHAIAALTPEKGLIVPDRREVGWGPELVSSTRRREIALPLKRIRPQFIG
jgi:hypothetical protein